MPFMGSYGAAAVRAWGRFQTYVRPAILRYGATGSVILTSVGASLSGLGDFTGAYIDAPKSAGKWYWEYEFVGADTNLHMTGVTVNPFGGLTYGGFQNRNAGVYSFGGTPWVDSTWAGGAISASSGTPSTGDIYGFALDMDSATKTLEVYQNGFLAAYSSWTAIIGPLYPLFTYQLLGMGAPAGIVRVGPAGCVYQPPAGYHYI